MRFGFDFDNTFVNYDKPAEIWSKRNGLGSIDSMKALKNFYRESRDYETDWIEVQEWLYTEGLAYATLGEGIAELIDCLRKKDSAIFIVSHKSNLSSKSKLNLIQPATAWLDTVLKQNFNGLIIPYFFAETREKKIEKIIELRLTHFVDDLPEIFQEENFPKDIQSFLINDHNHEDVISSAISINKFSEILKHV